MPQPISVIAVITAKEGQEAALRAKQDVLVAGTLKEEGCLRYELNQSLDDPRILIFTELWATEAHWRAHMEGAAIKAFQASGARDLIAEAKVHRMQVVAGK